MTTLPTAVYFPIHRAKLGELTAIDETLAVLNISAADVLA